MTSLARCWSIRVILVTDPQELEKVPIKVVPIYFDAPLTTQPIETPDVTPEPPRAKTPLIGSLAVGVAVGAAVLQAVAIAVATGGEYLFATVLAYLAIAFSIVAIGGGIVAVVLNRGRRLGIVALVAGVLANPVVLLAILSALGGLTLR